MLRDSNNIENRDAVLAYDSVELLRDETGKPVTRWDGRTYKKHPVTGEDVPNETARITIEKYISPRKAQWPQADFVVGSPPFICNKRLRQFVGDGYVDALRQTWSDVPESAEFVMYWWKKAAELLEESAIRRFGFITTNSIRQTFNRRVLDQIEKALSKLSAIPERSAYPKELLAVGLREYREIFFKPYRIIYRVMDKKVYVMAIADGRRDMQALLQRRMLQV